MNTHLMWKRLSKVEERVCPKRDDGQCTLEELCRAIWRRDAKRYRQMAERECGSLRYFIRQFEREDRGDR